MAVGAYGSAALSFPCESIQRQPLSGDMEPGGCWDRGIEQVMEHFFNVNAEKALMFY